MVCDLEYTKHLIAIWACHSAQKVHFLGLSGQGKPHSLLWRHFKNTIMLFSMNIQYLSHDQKVTPVMLEMLFQSRGWKLRDWHSACDHSGDEMWIHLRQLPGGKRIMLMRATLLWWHEGRVMGLREIAASGIHQWTPRTVHWPAACSHRWVFRKGRRLETGKLFSLLLQLWVTSPRE